jgi:hypothetical protein
MIYDFMNTESVDCRRVKVPRSAGDEKLLPGDFAWDFDAPECGGDRSKPTHYIYLALPGDAGGWSAIKVQKGQSFSGRVWGWDGNEDKPTLNPSILVTDQWHGYLCAGRLQSC